MSTKTIVLIHGAWLTPRSWDRFRARYEAAGYTVVSPAWPMMDRPVDELNRAPAAGLAQLGIRQIVDHYERIIRGLPESPIIMGHSFGGLFTQLLLDRGLGVAGVAIDPGPPFGVVAHPTAVWTSRAIFLGWNTWNRVMRMSLAGFSEGFAQLIPDADKPREHATQIVPCPGRIFWQAVLGIGSKATWTNPDRAPLLLTAGEFDRTVPAPMVRRNYRKQLRAPSPTALHEFAGRDHYLCNAKGWEEVADVALDWAVKHERHAPSLGVAAQREASMA